MLEHVIPNGQQDRFLTEGFYGFLAEVFLVDDDAENVFVEPFIREGQVSLVTGRGAPAVLEFPFGGFAVIVHVHGDEGHGVG